MSRFGVALGMVFGAWACSGRMQTEGECCSAELGEQHLEVDRMVLEGKVDFDRVSIWEMKQPHIRGLEIVASWVRGLIVP